MSKSRPLILAVDNAPMFLSTLKKLLEDTPYELHSVPTPDDAIAFLESSTPDLIMLDIEMPDMDGYDLAKKIKRMGVETPILFITANSEKEYADKATEAGAVGLLIKPLRRSRLLEKLTEIL